MTARASTASPTLGPPNELDCVALRDFIVIALPTVVDEFAENFDSLPIAYPNRPDYPVSVVGGTLIAASVVVGPLIADDSIVLLGIVLLGIELDFG